MDYRTDLYQRKCRIDPQHVKFKRLHKNRKQAAI